MLFQLKLNSKYTSHSIFILAKKTENNRRPFRFYFNFKYKKIKDKKPKKIIKLTENQYL